MSTTGSKQTKDTEFDRLDIIILSETKKCLSDPKLIENLSFIIHVKGCNGVCIPIDPELQEILLRKIQKGIDDRTAE